MKSCISYFNFKYLFYFFANPIPMNDLQRLYATFQTIQNT